MTHSNSLSPTSSSLSISIFMVALSCQLLFLNGDLVNSITIAPKMLEMNLSYGGLGFCPLCNNMNYSMSSDSLYWQDGNRTFIDPVPQGSIVTQILVITKRVFWCSSPMNSVGYFQINDELIGNFDQKYACGCVTCPAPITFSGKVYPEGFPNYNYGGMNSIFTNVTTGWIGIGDLTIVFTYIPNGPVYENVTISVPYAGCGFCDLCTDNNYTLSNGEIDCEDGEWNEGIQSFNDPLPKDSILINVTVLTTQFFWCSAPVIASFNINGIAIGEISESASQCGCDTCPDVQTVSSDSYVDGFPKYLYGNKNKFQIEAKKGVVGVKTIDLVLTYQVL